MDDEFPEASSRPYRTIQYDVPMVNNSVPIINEYVPMPSCFEGEVPMDSEDDSDLISRNEILKLTNEGSRELELNLKELRKKIAEEKDMKGVTHVISTEGIKQLVRF